MPDIAEVHRITDDEAQNFEEVVVEIRRTAKVVAGGKRLSFVAVVITGNRAGMVGWGYGKANEVPIAVEKAIRKARSNVIKVPLYQDRTLPHEIYHKYKATVVIMKPAAPGTGLRAASRSVRPILEMVGIKDCISKVMKSTNTLNTVKCVFEALRRIRSKQDVERLRGVRIGTPFPVPIKVKQ